MRANALIAFLFACSGKGDDSAAPSESDTDTDTDTDVAWEDLSLETSRTFDDLVVSGSSVTVVGSDTSVCHYNGTAWATPGGDETTPCWDRNNGLQTLPNLGEKGTLTIEEGTGLHDVWADPSGSGALVVVGDGGYIFEWNGSSWAGAWDVGTVAFEGIDGPSPSALIAVSWGAIYDNADGDWAEPEVLDGNPRFNDIWYDGTFALAAGEEGYIGSFGGASWTLSQDASYRKLHSVDALSSTDAWAVGEQGAALHFDGTTWTPEDVPTAASLWSVHMVASDDVYAVGANGVAAHWDGSEWKLLETGTNKNLLAVTAADGTIWAAGNRGGLFRFTP